MTIRNYLDEISNNSIPFWHHHKIFSMLQRTQVSVCRNYAFACSTARDTHLFSILKLRVIEVGNHCKAGGSLSPDKKLSS